MVELLVGPSGLAWSAALVILGMPVVADAIRDARHGRFATDIVAALAIVTALAMWSPIAGLVVVLMKRGGDALERHAEGRASEAVRALEAASPRLAHRVEGETVVDVPATAVTVGELLLVRPGELVPCDGVVVDGKSDVDTSSLTGEPVPVAVATGSRIMSGSANGQGVFRMRATAKAADSQYARIVALVRSAQSHKAPLQRVADRYAAWFTPATLVVCVIAFAASRDWSRVLAVLVVATPCPLILATPVAFVGGINRAARRHIIVRNGGALERLSRVTVAVFDKTGTITLGEPRLDRVQALPGWNEREVLRLAAALELGSSHRLARIISAAAQSRGIPVPAASAQQEQPGQGVTGTVEGRAVCVGGRSFVLSRSAADRETLKQLDGAPAVLRTYVGIDGRLAGVIEYAEQLRDDVADLLRALRAEGVGRTLLLSGDHEAHVRVMAARAGIADVQGDLLPEDKARVVGELTARGETVLMVGDGTNDAPALTAASVGIALAGHGGGITAEAADVIVLNDALGAVRDVMRIGTRTMRIARQSIWVGLGLSGAAMLAAAAGGIPPITGAVIQEAIDVGVILNALRTTRESP